MGSGGLTPFRTKWPWASVVAEAWLDHTRTPASGWPELRSATLPGMAKPAKAKWYQATAPTRTRAIGNGPPGRRGRGRCRRRGWWGGGSIELDGEGVELEYDQPRLEYIARSRRRDADAPRRRPL